MKKFIMLLSFIVSLSVASSALAVATFYCVASHPDSQGDFYTTSVGKAPVQKTLEACHKWADTNSKDKKLCKIVNCEVELTF